MNHEEKLSACYGIALILIILIGIAVSSGVFGGMSDLDAFKAAAGLP